MRSIVATGLAMDSPGMHRHKPICAIPSFSKSLSQHKGDAPRRPEAAQSGAAVRLRTRKIAGPFPTLSASRSTIRSATRFITPQRPHTRRFRGGFTPGAQYQQRKSIDDVSTYGGGRACCAGQLNHRAERGLQLRRPPHLQRKRRSPPRPTAAAHGVPRKAFTERCFATGA